VSNPHNVLRFARPAPCNDRRKWLGGRVEIYASECDGGSWAVYHLSRSGDSASFPETFSNRDEAVAFARKRAAECGADFDDGGDAA